MQGVGYRAATRAQARALGLHGWVCTLVDGRVELVACGVPQSLQELARWLQHGPASAQVEQVTQEVMEFCKFREFAIR